MEYTGIDGQKFVINDLTDEKLDEAINMAPRNDTDRQAQEFAKKLRALPLHVRKPYIKQHLESLKTQLKTDIQELEDAEAKIVILEDMKQWAISESFQLQNNDCSRLHKFYEACAAGQIYDDSTGELAKDVTKLAQAQSTFVVKHDWAAAFDKAEGYDENNEFKLPYDHCAFEFRINGKTIIAIALINPEDTVWQKTFTVFLECGKHWYCYGSDEKKADTFLGYVWSQIKAISIALEADVATHEIVRAPAKLNEKRAKAGKTPLRDYHVVDLSRRHRVANPSGGESGKKHRMHFVRGHWRHYEEHKTWIKWHLRGDPHLGFIQKHYAL